MPDARSLARLLGGDVHGNTISFPTPGHSPKDRGSVVRFDPGAPGGFLVNSFNGGDRREIREIVSKAFGLDLTAASFARPISAKPITPGRAADNQESALRLWREGHPPEGTLVERYLKSRGLFLPPATIEADVLRFHPSCSLWGQRHPAMIACMRDIRTDEIVAIHRTALRPDGNGKAEIPGHENAKAMLGSAKGAAIKLVSDAEVSMGLGITEGIENALTVLCKGWSPVWAAGSAGAVAKFPLLPGIETLTIFADPGEAGQHAAQECAERWQEGGSEAEIMSPPDNRDWNKWNTG